MLLIGMQRKRNFRFPGIFLVMWTSYMTIRCWDFAIVAHKQLYLCRLKYKLLKSEKNNCYEIQLKTTHNENISLATWTRLFDNLLSQFWMVKWTKKPRACFRTYNIEHIAAIGYIACIMESTPNTSYVCIENENDGH